ASLPARATGALARWAQPGRCGRRSGESCAPPPESGIHSIAEIHWSSHAPRNEPACRRILGWQNAVGSNFHFTTPTERKKQLHKVLGRVFRSLPDNRAQSSGNCCVKHYAVNLHSREVQAHILPRLKHG